MNSLVSGRVTSLIMLLMNALIVHMTPSIGAYDSFIGAFIDLSKQFDTVEDNIFLNELGLYSIKNKSLNLF